MASPRARLDRPRHIHPGGRGNRSHGGAGRARSQGSMRRGEGLADQDAGRQRVGDRAQESGLRGESCAYAAVDRHGGEPPGTGGHRKRAHRQLGTLRTERAGAAGTGRAELRWTILERASRRSAGCSSSMSTASRSTAVSSRAAAAPATTKRSSRPSWTSLTQKACRSPPKAWRRTSKANFSGRSAATSFKDFSCRARFPCPTSTGFSGFPRAAPTRYGRARPRRQRLAFAEPERPASPYPVTQNNARRTERRPHRRVLVASPVRWNRAESASAGDDKMALGRLALALIGILAYRNRDKLGALLRGEGQTAGGPAGSQSGSILDDIANKFGAGDALRQVLDRFKAAGSGETVDCWVKQGPSQPIQPDEVEAAIDAETLDALSRQTGMSRDELLRRLASGASRCRRQDDAGRPRARGDRRRIRRADPARRRADHPPIATAATSKPQDRLNRRRTRAGHRLLMADNEAAGAPPP